MKKLIYLLLLGTFITTTSNAQTTGIKRGKNDYVNSYWLNFGTGAAAVLSTDVFNSGAILPFYMELYFQQNKTRLGLGLSHEIYLTPENLYKLATGNSANVEKFYLTAEWMLLRNFPLNIGACAQFGGFYVGNQIKENTKNKNEKVDDASLFGNVGLVAEAGIRPFFLFVKPYLEYKSYALQTFHKELIAGVNFGIRLKFLSEEEKQKRGK